MRKILCLTICFILLLSVALPVLAQEELNECCKIGHTFKLKSGQLTKPDDTKVDCSVLANCQFTKDVDIVGPKIGATCDVGSINTEYKEWGMICMLNTINVITNWLFYLLMILVTLMIIYGGFTYMTAAGDPEKAGKAKGVITFALIGFAVALLAKFIPSIVRAVLGV